VGKLFVRIAVVIITAGMVLAGCDNPVAKPGTETFTVTFNSAGGSLVPSISDIAAGYTITLPAAPTKADHTFGGWYTGANGGGTAFTGETPVTANITLYAKWTQNSTDTPELSVYVAGSIRIESSPGKYADSPKAAYWKDGVKKSLPIGSYDSEAIAAAVSGTTVFIAGYDQRQSSQNDNACIWKSNDGGETWTQKRLPESAGKPFDMAVSGSCIYVAGNENDSLYCWKSEDAGDTWEKITVAGTEQEPTGWQILVSGSALYITGDTGNDACYWESGDEGETWTKTILPAVNVSNPHAQSMAVSGLDMYITSTTYSSSERAIIWKSTDGGTTWTESAINDGTADTPKTLSGCGFLDSGAVYIVGCTNKKREGSSSLPTACLWLSTDRGNSWSRTDLDSANYSAGVYSTAVSNSTIYIIGWATSLSTFSPRYWELNYAGEILKETTLTDGSNRPAYSDIALVWE
jgi:uncharacterized repeat protein (TIGR02543 family)